jgi:FkbM family methyltransferase
MNSAQILSPQTESSRQQRRERWRQAIGFARARGSSMMERCRLLYHLGLKPSLVFRRFSHYTSDRILSFSLRATAQTDFQIFARDDGLGVGTFAEFFQPRHVMMPPELAPMKPKVIYDLGANIGAASLYFATLYPDAHFYAFEPMPVNYEICALNYRNLPNSRVFPWAVGARSEIATFECKNDPRGGGLSGSVTNPGLQSAGQFDVQVFSIADLIRVQKLDPPDFL